MARSSRHDTRCTATESPIVSIAPTSVTKMNAGSRAQKTGPKLRSNPGQPAVGSPIHGAAATCSQEKSWKKPAVTHPATIPITGPHMRITPAARSTITSVTPRVTSAVTGPAAGAAPSGTCSTRSRTSGMTVTAISMITVPATVGVMRRRSSDRRDARRNWKSAEVATSVASMPGPPSASAVTDTAMKAPDVPIRRM